MMCQITGQVTGTTSSLALARSKARSVLVDVMLCVVDIDIL
jgi:hypothetical protein